MSNIDANRSKEKSTFHEQIIAREIAFQDEWVKKILNERREERRRQSDIRQSDNESVFVSELAPLSSILYPQSSPLHESF